LYGILVRHARQKGVSTLVDTYGECFRAALEAVPDAVKLNRHECEQALGLKLDSPQSIREALQRIRDAGVRYVAVTCGSLGMAAAWDQNVAAWKPPAVHLVNPIGAGDAMTAGLIDALSRRDEPALAFRWAMACAVASVEHWVACDFQRSAEACCRNCRMPVGRTHREGKPRIIDSVPGSVAGWSTQPTSHNGRTGQWTTWYQRSIVGMEVGPTASVRVQRKDRLQYASRQRPGHRTAMWRPTSNTW
jgi:hypothetical protein